MRGKKQALRQLTGLFSPKRKLTRLSEACKWHVQMCPSTLFKGQVWLLPLWRRLLRLSPLAPVQRCQHTARRWHHNHRRAGACRQNGLRPLTRGPVWPGLNPPKTKNINSRATQNSATRQTDTVHSSYRHPAPKWPIPSSCGGSTGAEMPTALDMVGLHSGQGPGFQNFEGPNWKW